VSHPEIEKKKKELLGIRPTTKLPIDTPLPLSNLCGNIPSTFKFFA
jgi:hypothetical protein